MAPKAAKQMSLLKFTLPREAFSTTDTANSSSLSFAEAEQVTREVRQQQQAAARVTTPDWTAAEKLEVGRLVVEEFAGSIKKAMDRWNSPLSNRRRLTKGTASRFAEVYRKDLKKKKTTVSLLSVEGPPAQRPKRGRPSIMTDREQKKLLNLLVTLRRNGAQVTAHTVSSSARGIVKVSDDRSRLVTETTLGVEWSRKWLASQGWTLRASTTAACLNPGVFEEKKAAFVSEVKALRAQYNIPPDLIINADHTALPLLPTSTKTFEKKGSEIVPLMTSEDKRSITGVFV